MVHSTVALLLLLRPSSTTLTGEAKIVDITAHGFVLALDKQVITADDDPLTRYWLAKAPGLRDGFHVGDTVGVRIKTDVSPAQLREIADVSTWRWLDFVRKEAVAGTVTRADAKWLTLRLDDGSSFTYHITSKSSAQLSGQPLPIASLPEGTRVYVKGRLTSTLETSVVTVTDSPPIVPAGSNKRGHSKSPPLRLAQSGAIRGSLSDIHPSFRMFDMNVQDRLLHVTYSKDTRFFRNGSRIAATDMQKGWEVQIAYRRDAYGRLIASKVELFASSGS